MASSNTLQIELNIERAKATHSRSTTLLWLGAAYLIGQWLTMYGTEEGSVSYFFNSLCFPLFPLVAGLKCLHTARSLEGAGRGDSSHWAASF